MLDAYKLKSHFDNGNMYELQEMIDAEIAILSTKEIGGATLAKRRTTANKYLKSIDIRDELKSSFDQVINGSDYQCFCNGYSAIALDTRGNIPNLTDYREHKTGVAPISLDGLFRPFFRGEYPEIEVDLSAVVTAYKKPKDGKKYATIEINGQDFDSGLFYNAMTILGGDIHTYGDGKGINPVYLQSDNGVAMILPLRKP